MVVISLEQLHTIQGVHSFGETAGQTAACVRGLRLVITRQAGAGSVLTVVAMEVVDVMDAR